MFTKCHLAHVLVLHGLMLRSLLSHFYTNLFQTHMQHFTCTWKLQQFNTAFLRNFTLYNIYGVHKYGVHKMKVGVLEIQVILGLRLWPFGPSCDYQR